MAEIPVHLILIQLFIITLIVCDQSGVVKRAASCKLCKKSVEIVDNAAGLQRHASEVLISNDCDVQSKEEILKLEGCGGTIYSSMHIVTTATCFNDEITSPHYCVYANFLNLNDDREFQKFFSDTITLHPNFNSTTGEYDLAVIKLKDIIIFEDTVTWIKLPDEPINTKKFDENDCYVVGYDTDKITKKLQTFSAKVELLNYDECEDIARINSAHIIINPKQYCILSKNFTQLENFHIVGKGVICKGVVSGLLTKKSLQLTEDIVTPIVDVGKHSTWLRSKMLNLRPVIRSAAIIINPNNAVFIISLVYVL